MSDRTQFNPYEQLLAPALEALPVVPESYILTANGIRCRGSIALPAICLQTGETGDLRAIQLWPKVGASMWKLWLPMLIAGIAYAVSVVILFYLQTIPSAIGVPTLFAFMVGLTCVAGLCFAGFGWRFFTLRITVKGFVSRRTHRAFFGGFPLALLTGLPMFVFMFAPLLWQQRFFALREGWSSLAFMALALASGRILSGLLERHWKSTRNRGLELSFTKSEDGTFEVTGFTQEFLTSMRFHEQTLSAASQNAAGPVMPPISD